MLTFTNGRHLVQNVNIFCKIITSRFYLGNVNILKVKMLVVDVFLKNVGIVKVKYQYF